MLEALGPLPELTPGPSLSTINDVSVKAYGYLTLWATTRDSQGVEDKRRTRFLVVEAPEIGVILGLEWLREENPVVDWETLQWRYRIERKRLHLSHQAKDTKRARVAIAMTVNVTLEGDDKNNWKTENHEKREKRIPKAYIDFSKVFSVDDAATAIRHQAAEHRIELEEGKEPPFGPLYPLSAKELEVLRVYLQESEAKGWIRSSNSPAGAPILFVPKKGGTLRLCVDYRGLNKISRKDRAPLPLIQEILDRLSTAKVMTKLDLKDAYHRIRIRKGDEWKTAFRTRYGHFEYLVMPFGLANAPATFQTYINRALGGLVDTICIVYLDDILIYSEDIAEHNQHVREVLARLDEWGLYANLEKCEFDVTEVTFLGFVVSPEGINMERHRIDAVAAWPDLHTVQDIQIFLGFTGFYRRFIKGYAKITLPLTDKLRKNRSTTPLIGAREQEAFRQLQEAFQTAPLLQHFDPTLPTRLETDASAFAIGAIISQLFEGRWHPIAFRSRKMTPEETRYDTGDGELLAVVDAFATWRQYLTYPHETIEVITDHMNLQFLEKKQRPNARQVRWLNELAAFDFKIKYRAGALNPADGLSRRPDHSKRTGEEVEDRSLETALLKKLPSDMRFDGTKSFVMRVIAASLGTSNSGPAAKRQKIRGKPNGTPRRSVRFAGRRQQDETAPRIRKDAAASARREEGPEEGPVDDVEEGPLSDHILHLQRRDAFVTEGKWKAVRPHGRPGKTKLWEVKEQGGPLYFKGGIYVPNNVNVRKEVIEQYHDMLLGGHGGVMKTYTQIRRNYHWQTLRREVREYVATCTTCQRTKPRTHRPYGLLKTLPIPREAFAEITVDFVTGLPPSYCPISNRICDAILVVVDRLTKTAYYIATTKKLTANGFAELLFYRCLKTHGIPDGIVSDRGSLFTSNFWTSLCGLFGIKRRLSTAWHPQTDGQTERLNQILEHYLRCYCDIGQSDWGTRLATAEMIYNGSYQSAIKMTPAEALMGYKPALPGDAAPLRTNREVPAADKRVAKLRMEREIAKASLLTAHAHYVKHYNKHRKNHHFNEDDWVLLSTKNINQQRPSKKLSDKYIGPFKVIGVKDSKLAYQLELPPTMKVHDVFPISLLELYRSREDTEPSTVRRDIAIEAEKTWDIEKILSHRGPKAKRQYLIKWKNFPASDNSWEPRKHFVDSSQWEDYEKAIREGKTQSMRYTDVQET